MDWMRWIRDCTAIFWIGGRGHGFLRSELAVHVGQGDGGLNGADIHTDDDAVVIQSQEGGTAAPREPAGGAFQHPILIH